MRRSLRDTWAAAIMVAVSVVGSADAGAQTGSGSPAASSGPSPAAKSAAADAIVPGVKRVTPPTPKLPPAVRAERPKRKAAGKGKTAPIKAGVSGRPKPPDRLRCTRGKVPAADGKRCIPAKP